MKQAAVAGKLIIPVILLVTAVFASAHPGPDSALLDVRYQDTLQLQEGTNTLTNKLILQNRSATDSFRLIIHLRAAAGWRFLTQETQHIVLPPASKKVVVLSMLADQQSNTLLSAQEMVITLGPGIDSIVRQFVVKRKATARLFLESRAAQVELFGPGETSRDLPVYLRNEGNVPSNYLVKWSLYRLNLFDETRLSLMPGEDTVLYYHFSLPTSDLRQLQSDLLRIAARDDSNNSKEINQRLSYYSRSYSEYPSAYNTFPLSITSGVFSKDNSVTNAFFSLRGRLNLSEDSRLNFYYRSKDYLITNNFQQDIFNVSLESGRWRFAVGQSQRNNDFNAYGNEISAGLRWGKEGSFSVWGIKSYKGLNYSNDQLGASLTQMLGKVKLEHTLIAAVDSQQQINGALFSEKLRLVNSKHISLSVIGGSGLNISPSAGLTHDLGNSLGYSLGYSLFANFKSLTINSTMTHNSDRYPGVYRGMKSADHLLSFWLTKSFFLAPFYSSNKVTNNFGIDTLLNSNWLHYNMEKYGLRTGINTKRLKLHVEAGNYKNTTMSTLPIYKYTELGFEYRSKHSFKISLNSQSGIAKNQFTGKEDIWFTNSRASAGSRYFRFSGMYFRYPTLQANGDGSPGFTENISLMGGFRFRIAKRLDGNIDYELDRYTVNDIITHNALFHLTYSGRKNGISLALDGSVPLQQTGEDKLNYLAGRNYMQLSLTKSFNVPIITRKKYLDLKVHLFLDANGNGIKDGGELPLAESMISINNRLMISSSKGYVNYLNAEPGSYTIDLTKVSPVKGYLPARGYSETVSLTRDMVLEIPYSPGRTICGEVQYDVDSYSNIRYRPDGLKVIIMDTAGKVLGHALTDEAGKFSYTLPAGRYRVSLNPSAFNEQMKPVQMEFPADLTTKEACNIVFVVKQKRREINLIKRN